MFSQGMETEREAPLASRSATVCHLEPSCWIGSSRPGHEAQLLPSRPIWLRSYEKSCAACFSRLQITHVQTRVCFAALNDGSTGGNGRSGMPWESAIHQGIKTTKRF